MFTKQRTLPWLVVIGYLMLLVAVIGQGFYCLTLYVLPVSKDLGISRSVFSLMYVFSGVSSGILTVFLIRITKKISAKRLAFIGGILSVISYIIFAVAIDIWYIYIVGAMLGLATVFAGTSIAQIGIVPWFNKKLGTALGIVGAASGLGTAIFSPILGKIISKYGWRFACYFEAGIILLITVVTNLFFIKESPAKIGMLPYGEDITVENTMTTRNKLVSPKTISGISLKEAAHSPKLYLMFIGIFIVTLSYQILSLHQSPMIQDKGFTLEQASYCLSVFAISNMMNKIISGCIQDKFGFRAVCAYCAIAVAIGICFMLFGTTLFAMIVFSALFGFWPSIIALYGLFAGTHLFGQKDSTAWISVGQLGISIGGLLGPGLASWIYGLKNQYTQLLYILLGTIGIFFIISMLLFGRKTKYVMESEDSVKVNLS